MSKKKEVSLDTLHSSVPTNGKSRWRRLFSFLGPAYLVSVGYMDPGNWATDIAGGSQFGYSLIWVLLMSNIVAIFLQGLCVRLGIVYGRDLAQANKESYPKFLNISLYVLAELAIIATDLAEVLGMAIGINLLSGLPLIYGVLITILDTFLLMYLQRIGIRKMEVFIISMVAIILFSFVLQNLIVAPEVTEIVKGFVPHLENDQALYIAIGIIGATVMPHNLYLHSALVQTRKIQRTKTGIKRAIRLNFIDSAVALNLAFFVNAGILILAAGTFFKNGLTEVAEIKDAYELLTPLLGSKIAPILFAVALIMAGQSSTITGTLAGQIVMEGYLNWRINPLFRRFISRSLAVVPAFLVILVAGDKSVDKLLIFSQVILSLQLGFAIIPLIYFVSDKEKMKTFVIPLWQKILAWSIVVLLLYLNLKMVQIEMGHIFIEHSNPFLLIFLVLLLLALAFLLLVIILYPLLKKRFSVVPTDTNIHTMTAQTAISLKVASVSYRTIAVALDFSSGDMKVLNYALTNAAPHSRFVLIHIVESATAKFLGSKSGDIETLNDEKLLKKYAACIEKEGYAATTVLGFNNRVQEITKIIREQKADLLVIGAHGHSGLNKQFVFGKTIDEVRQNIRIPLLIVNY